MIEILYSKIHRATITDSNLNYEGSITLGNDLISAAGLYEYQKVQVVDIDNGNRFETYIIASQESGCICVNGAAARLVSKGDKVIILSYVILSELEAESHNPIIVKVDVNNVIV